MSTPLYPLFVSLQGRGCIVVGGIGGGGKNPGDC
jgi:hypothetical protein